MEKAGKRATTRENGSIENRGHFLRKMMHDGEPVIYNDHSSRLRRAITSRSRKGNGPPLEAVARWCNRSLAAGVAVLLAGKVCPRSYCLVHLS